MKKNRVFLPLLLSLAVLCPTARATAPSMTVFDIEYPEITAPYAILVDATHDVILFEQNAHDITYPASTTKIMTGLLVAEAISQGYIAPYTMVTATEEHTVDLSIYGSTQGISVGEEMSVIDLLHCLLLASANESGNILAIHIAGDLETFVAMMNTKAEELGCLNTHFMNTHGLHDDEHYTTAYDLYLIMKEAMTYDTFAQVVGESVYSTSPTNMEDERMFYNTNGLLSEWYYKGYSYDYCIGGKTGSTPEAGRCLVAAADKNGEYMISAVLGTSPVTLDNGTTLLPQMSESRTLLSFGIDEFEYRTITPSSDPVGQVGVTLSDESDSVLLRAEGEIQKLLPVDMDLSEIKADVHIAVETVEAPVVTGTAMGTMTLSYNGEIYGVLDVVTMHDVERSEILYKKQQMETFVDDYAWVMGATVVAMGAGVAGVQYSMEKKRRKHSWRNNQRNRRR